MIGGGHGRWARVLLVLATLFGVVAMHATIAPMHDRAGSMTAVATSAGGGSAAHDLVVPMPVGDADTTVTASSSMPGDGPMSMPHALMHLCLAVMALGVLLGLLLVVLITQFRRNDSPSLQAPQVSTRPSRPPAPHAVRLAQLCVLRN